MSRVDRYPAALNLLLELVVLLNADMNQRLARDGLTTSRTAVLWTVRQRGPVTQRVLAEALNVTARTVTGLIDGLVESGHVTREPHPTDRRATLVTFTRRGTRVVQALEREQTEFTQQLFADLSDARFDGLVGGLDHVLNVIRELLGMVKK